VTGRRGRRRRKLLDDLKERRGYSHLKEEALDRTMWRAGFGRGFGPVARKNTKSVSATTCFGYLIRHFLAVYNETQNEQCIYKHSIEESSCNHCCSGKAKSIIYSELFV